MSAIEPISEIKPVSRSSNGATAQAAGPGRSKAQLMQMIAALIQAIVSAGAAKPVAQHGQAAPSASGSRSGLSADHGVTAEVDPATSLAPAKLTPAVQVQPAQQVVPASPAVAATASASSGAAAVGAVGKTRAASGSTLAPSNPDELLASASPVAYGTSAYGNVLSQNKQAITTALDAAGATPKEKAMVLGMFMMETQNMSASQGDRTKDGHTDGSQNVSGANMNVEELKGDGTPGAPGVPGYDPNVDLNDPANIGKAAVLCLNGLRSYGAMNWITAQRGGVPAAERLQATGSAASNPNDPSEGHYYQSFNTSLATVYQAILSDPSLESNDLRVEPKVDVPGG